MLRNCKQISPRLLSAQKSFLFLIIFKLFNTCTDYIYLKNRNSSEINKVAAIKGCHRFNISLYKFHGPNSRPPPDKKELFKHNLRINHPLILIIRKAKLQNIISFSAFCLNAIHAGSGKLFALFIHYSCAIIRPTFFRGHG